MNRDPRTHPKPGDAFFSPDEGVHVVQHVADDGTVHVRVDYAVKAADWAAWDDGRHWGVDPQSVPTPSEGDVWDELIRVEAHDGLRALYSTRRAKGLGTYGVPLQRDNGRNFRQDLTEELLDGMAYAQGADLPDVVAAIRDVLLMTEAPRA